MSETPKDEILADCWECQGKGRLWEYDDDYVSEHKAWRDCRSCNATGKAIIEGKEGEAAEHILSLRGQIAELKTENAAHVQREKAELKSKSDCYRRLVRSLTTLKPMKGK